MGNWPSASDSSSISITSDDQDSEENALSRENLACGSERSFFSEEEVFPDDGADDEKANDDEGEERLERRNDNQGSYPRQTLIASWHKGGEGRQEQDEADGDEYDDDDSDGTSSLPQPLPSPDLLQFPVSGQVGSAESLPCATDNSSFLGKQTQDRNFAIGKHDVLQEKNPETDNHIGEFVSPVPVLAWEIDVSDITGSKMVTKKRVPKRNSKKASAKENTMTIPAYVPPSVSTTTALIAQRKVLDQRRWFCMSRPQYSKSCGLSSLASCWNYLFSTLGMGTMPPITQEEALTVLGFKPPFGEIRFGPFTGNAALMRWFKQLNDHYSVRGRAYYQYKPHGRGKTVGRSSEEGLHMLKRGLQDPNMAFIYHCYNHYFCPIGFEDVPQKAVDAYRDPLQDSEVNTWILIGDPSRRHPGIHCFKWEDISIDLNCQNPEYLNIRKLHLGVQRRRTKKTGGNLHCIMAFSRSAGFRSQRGGGRSKREMTSTWRGQDASRYGNRSSTADSGMSTGDAHGRTGFESGELISNGQSVQSDSTTARQMNSMCGKAKSVASRKSGSGSKRTKKQRSWDDSSSETLTKNTGIGPNGMKSDKAKTVKGKLRNVDVETQDRDITSAQVTSESDMHEITRFIEDASIQFGLDIDDGSASAREKLGWESSLSEYEKKPIPDSAGCGNSRLADFRESA